MKSLIIKKNEVKPYGVGQILSIKDGMALSLKFQQRDCIRLNNNVLKVVHLLRNTPIILYARCTQELLIIIDDQTYYGLVQFCRYLVRAFLSIFALTSHLGFHSIYELAMLTGVLKTAQKVGSHANAGRITPQIGKVSYATYQVDNAKPSSTIHEQSQKNPLLEKQNGEAFQHPAYVRIICSNSHCEHNLCKEMCDTPVENADVGHATHSGSYPTSVFISEIDSCNQNRPEYMVPYTSPIENTTGGVNINLSKTANLNNNPQALNNVHMNSSREPAQKTNIGSNDTTNIN